LEQHQKSQIIIRPKPHLKIIIKSTQINRIRQESHRIGVTNQHRNTIGTYVKTTQKVKRKHKLAAEKAV